MPEPLPKAAPSRGMSGERSVAPTGAWRQKRAGGSLRLFQRRPVPEAAIWREGLDAKQAPAFLRGCPAASSQPQAPDLDIPYASYGCAGASTNKLPAPLTHCGVRLPKPVLAAAYECDRVLPNQPFGRTPDACAAGPNKHRCSRPGQLCTPMSAGVPHRNLQRGGAGRARS